MGLLKNILGKGKPGRESQTVPGSLPMATSIFQESEPAQATAQVDDEQSSRNQRRRELVQLVLRDTMRRHGIPSDWIESRILTVASRSKASGMHLQFIVRQGEDRLITYVHAFQDSFRSELQRFEPKAGEWLFSISWQFDGKVSDAEAMPDPGSWAAPASAAAASALAAPAADAPAQPAHDAALEEDLKALFAIRDAVLQGRDPQQLVPPDPKGAAARASRDEGGDVDEGPADFQPTRPGA